MAQWTLLLSNQTADWEVSSKGYDFKYYTKGGLNGVDIERKQRFWQFWNNNLRLKIEHKHNLIEEDKVEALVGAVGLK